MNTTKTEQFIEILKLNDYLRDELETNLLYHYTSFEHTLFKFNHFRTNIIDSLFELVELHKEYKSLDFIIFDLDVVSYTISTSIDNHYRIECYMNINLIETLKEIFPEFAKELRLKTIEKLLC